MPSDLCAFGVRVAEALDVELASPPGATDDLFGDCGLDSLQAFQLLVLLEDMADIARPPLEIPEIYTLGDAYAYYGRLIAERA